ncbi:hypothetical protein ACRAWC_22850 [Leifsonia sp. L25]|uniref:hypothetical protein n=1 Tax=Leifsonia sp. L25 TaxID=3423957 RepID=UPI003D6856F7
MPLTRSGFDGFCAGSKSAGGGSAWSVSPPALAVVTSSAPSGAMPVSPGLDTSPRLTGLGLGGLGSLRVAVGAALPAALEALRLILGRGRPPRSCSAVRWCRSCSAPSRAPHWLPLFAVRGRRSPHPPSSARRSPSMSAITSSKTLRSLLGLDGTAVVALEVTGEPVGGVRCR